MTRRGLLALGGAATAGAGVAVGVSLAGHDSAAAQPKVPFHGVHQAGITTAPQGTLLLTAFDLSIPDPSALRQLLIDWSGASARLMAGQNASQGSGSDRPPLDLGEARDLPPARLTLTIGLGGSLFDRNGTDPLGLRSRMPARLRPLPSFRGEALEGTASDGDLCVQACADDPQVAFHAIHVLTRVAAGIATPRWAYEGFRSPAEPANGRRNLFGFKEGTGNLPTDNADAMAKHVWAREPGPAGWMTGGSYVVIRRVRMLFDVWDHTTLDGQERAIGRHKLSGAPLGGRSDSEPLQLDRRSPSGSVAIPHDAHVRLASAEANGGARLLRRSYAYSNGVEPGSGQLDAGLIFICFQRDPHQQFARIQRRLAANDALNKHVLHTGSALFACPPGVTKDGYLADGLLET